MGVSVGEKSRMQDLEWLALVDGEHRLRCGLRKALPQLKVAFSYRNAALHLLPSL